ncbi:rod shape-determining protein [candidate division WS6 bacterium RIFOXYD1_FULL_33_8]|uniref:Cell shape-determining protein MreB n=2 Tax=Candidatus Dojkabacteria TaxID=74243 RepID=A0A0G0CUV3_9BACT|nr:MAG: rod shape-determining protein MreB, rod shape-determining protein MreB [candidate division WS6 bacterium GW2011_GWE2_33_157]KKP44433.1 MAG: rod shape-determining protein MreB, rod shape-determining protein MreB [candidate division WS6 bacterium GW2011_GWF1_33_233]KKP44723.1 MAG: rod shape-determining protein MreB, rod shape-determining protein MreB [candidate division WS6 bacterium GW2011_GWC1_33_20]KKP53973.1 MAG: rod shape-determining protein MreB, rod shape-determining protein MreB [c
MSIFDSIWELFTYDLGMDLGTANTMVYLRGEGIVVSEPSVVAIDKRSKQVLAVGQSAREMIGRTPANIVAVRPLRDGVISDFDTTQAMIHHFIKKAHNNYIRGFKIPRPRIVVGVPSSITEVERQAVIDAAKTAGAREVFIVEEAMAAAIGIGLPIEDPSGSMVVDVGGGTTDIAVLSLGDIVVDNTVRIAGDEMNQDIVDYVRDKYNMLIGERSAEDVKIEIGSASPFKQEKEVTLQGRDLITGLPKSIKFSSTEVREAINVSLSQITEAIKDAIEDTPPELLKDIFNDGIFVAGGGALIKGLDTYWREELNMPINIVEDPMASVAKGTAKMLDHIDLLQRVQKSWEELI